MTTSPEGWRDVALGDVIAPISQRVVPDCGSEIPFIGMEHVEAQSGRVLEYGNASVIKSASPLAEAGDVLYGRLRPYLNKVAIAPERAYTSGEFIVFRGNDQIDGRWLKWRFTAQDFVDYAVSLNAGDRPRVKWPQMKPFRLNLPLLAEQHRIVELLEDHLSRIDAATGSMRVALRRLEVLRRLVVRDLAVGETVPLKQLSADWGYGTSVKCEIGGAGPAVVRIPNLVDGRIDLTDEKRAIDPTVDLSSAMLVPGDVLIIRTNGSKDLIGRSGVVQEGIDAAFASYLIRYQVDPSRLRPEWLHTMLGSPKLRAEIERRAASSAGQHNLSLGKLDGLLIPTPTLEEQDVGLAHLAELDEQLEALRRVLSVGLRRGESLRRSLLAAAFSGALSASTRSAA